MTAPLIIAVPSKGRLEEKTTEYFARAGLRIERPRGARNYRGGIAGIDGVTVAFLSATEITAELAAGNVHLGVTGEDLVREHIPDVDGIVEIVAPLGFGMADVVVAVPRAWIDVVHLEDLVDVAQGFHSAHGRRLRVASKYTTLTSRFFAAHGLTDYRIVQSQGATEGAPAAGTADIIVDITSTGSTLFANDLKVPAGGIILRSEANLVASLGADWSGIARAALAHILVCVAAQDRAGAVYELRAEWPADDAPGEISTLIAHTGSVGINSTDALVVLHVPRPKLHEVTQSLKTAGANRISVYAPEYVFGAETPLLDRLNAAIEKKGTTTD